MSMNRRAFVKAGTLGTAALGFAAPATFAAPGAIDLKGNVNHSVCKWCYPNITLEALAAAAGPMGIGSIELLHPADFPVLKQYGLVCAMVNAPDTGHHHIDVGFNRTAHHEFLVPAYLTRLEETAAAGFERVICFSGVRDGLDDDQGLENCAAGIKQIIGTAERLGLTVCMELLNSKAGGHVDYQCDHTAWGVALVDRVGSDHFKLLYDIYHMQIMEGDVIRTLRENKDYIAHYHTGGNPGRHEIDDTQELNYPAIMKAVVETGFTGYTAQEFIPTRAPLTSLGQAIALCDV